LDSYTPILAMVAAGAGWTILTPLALHHAARFREAVDLQPLPFEPLGRTLSLQARAGVLRDMPGDVAVRLRRLLDRQVVQPTRALWPWLGDTLRTL
ncbi:MAG: LysR family transcriptional regulator, partial [Rhodobacteraceae bacterium]|nr:LysR family transcriptional regulator [Paracoccaceae bacterium]MCZ8133620.1 LysR family transcriptional regulator [Paracoccaceae bacterium]